MSDSCDRAPFSLNTVLNSPLAPCLVPLHLAHIFKNLISHQVVHSLTAFI